MTEDIPDGIGDLTDIRDRALHNLRRYEERLQSAIDSLNCVGSDLPKTDQAALLRNYEKANLQLIDVMLKIEKTKKSKFGEREPEIDFEAARREILAKIAAYDTNEEKFFSSKD
jgi:hypothetical protein